MDAGTEASVLGAMSRPVAFVVLILAFLAGAWVGRGSVLLETRARRRHLDEAVGKIVAGVVEGLKGTSGVSTPAPTNAAAAGVTPFVGGVLAGLATPRRNADADPGAAAGPRRLGSREARGPGWRPSLPASERARARARRGGRGQTLARAEAVASAAAAASAAGRADMSTSSAPRRDDSDSDDAAEREVTSRSVPLEETVIATVIDGTDETTRADDADDRVSETDDLPVEMDVDASMEDAFPPEEGDGGEAPADAPADVSSLPAEFFARTETRADAPENRRDGEGERKQNERRNDDVPRRSSARDIGLDARGAHFGPDEDDEKNASLAESRSVETPRATPASVVAPSSPDAALSSREPESPTRLAAAAAHEAQRAAEIERQRGAAKAAKKAARSERVLAERMLSHRKGIEEAEARASEMDDARVDAQRFLERSGAHALAAAGCMGATLLRLELIDATAADLRSMPENKLEGAYKRALAKNHPDRSAARGDDVAAAARCEETFKLLQAAHLRWTEMGKPIGDAADARARANGYPFGAHTSSAAFSSSTRGGGGGGGGGSPGFYASRRTQAAAAAAAAASAAAAANGGGRSWRPGESVNAGAPPSGAAARTTATRSGNARGEARRRRRTRCAARRSASPPSSPPSARASVARARAEEARRAAS